MRAALGFAPHSGWAAVVAVGGDAEDPRVLRRERVVMADADDPGSKQPYHAVEGRPLEEARRRLAAYERDAAGRAAEAIRRLGEDLARGGQPVAGAGILESAGRKGTALAETLASHALIHTADGNHFRDALASAVERAGLHALRVRARDLEKEAAAALGRPPEALADVVRRMGTAVGPPWGADQKQAALLAWLVLRKCP